MKHTKEKLRKKSKTELIKILLNLQEKYNKRTMESNNRLYQIKHFRIRLKKMRDSMDYLLSHPYSNDANITRRKK